MSTITLRGIDEKTADALKERAKREGTSVNAVTLRLLRESLGIEKRKRAVTYSDLDHLAGTWGQQEATEFAENTAVFEKVDENLWKKPKKYMDFRNEDITAIVAEIPEGHLHLRTTLTLADGSSLTFQEATVAAIVRAYVAVKTDPVRRRVVLKGQKVADRKKGYAEWQLLEEA